MNPERSIEFREHVTFPNDLIAFAGPSPPTAASAPTQHGNRLRILIAEDDPVSCQILATRLQKWDYDVVIARDGREAMTVMRSTNAPSLAVLDWMMPGMDGIEVCRRLREVNKAVYIIFLTSLETKENIRQALDAGADDYLVKPFDTFALQTRIRVGLRIIGLQGVLASRVTELEKALLELRELRGELPVPL
jgi:DNA-binding response OmpR family regulator